MTVDFTLSRDSLLFGDNTTLRVIPPSPAVPGISYTWTIPEGFSTVTGSMISPQVVIQAPASGTLPQVPITLSAKAVNYCDASRSHTVTVKCCYNPPSSVIPKINSNNANEENGIFHVNNLQNNINFYTSSIDPWKEGGAATYTWQIDKPGGSSFTPSTQPNSTTFITKAPSYSDNTTYTITLQVTADGYCSFPPVNKKVVVDPAGGKLTGKVKIVEAVRRDAPPNDSVVWLVKDRATTLTASYEYGTGENVEAISLKYKWYWINDTGTPIFTEENNGKLSFTPGTATESHHQLRIEAHDLNGKQQTTKNYAFVVKECESYNLPGLQADVNHTCGIMGGYSYAYVKDETGGDDTYTYLIKKFGNKWWFTENLRSNKQRNANTTYVDTYGAYYPGNLASELGNTDGKYCPKGWRTPTLTEWTSLETTVGESSNTEMAFKKLASTETAIGGQTPPSTAWNSSLITNIPGEDRLGFNLIPAGYYLGSSFYGIGQLAAFFISDHSSNIQVYGTTSYGAGKIERQSKVDGHLYTVRCVND